MDNQIFIDSDALLKKPNNYHLAVFAYRPGADKYIQHIESSYYPPGTSLNRFFDVYVINWQIIDGVKDSAHLFFVISVPGQDKQALFDDAGDYNLVIRDGCVPVAITMPGLANVPAVGSLRPENVAAFQKSGYQVKMNFPLKGVSGTLESTPESGIYANLR